MPSDVRRARIEDGGGPHSPNERRQTIQNGGEPQNSMYGRERKKEQRGGGLCWTRQEDMLPEQSSKVIEAEGEPMEDALAIRTDDVLCFMSFSLSSIENHYFTENFLIVCLPKVSDFCLFGILRLHYDLM